MKYKAILLDIDNTLYDYNKAHYFAKNKILNYCMDAFSLSKDEIILAYERARKQVHIELCETAASHNRLLYFQNFGKISLEGTYLIGAGDCSTSSPSGIQVTVYRSLPFLAVRLHEQLQNI
jgi:FMN phosphatase YigB (HAD superfamily)